MSADNKQQSNPEQSDTGTNLSQGTGPEGDALAFLDVGQDGAVNLDALFDALNIAAGHDSGSMDYVANNEGGGTLIISGAELVVDPGVGTGEELVLQTEHMLKSAIVSDES